MSEYELQEPTLDFTQKGMSMSLFKFWGVQLVVSIIVYLVIIIIFMFFGQRNIIGAVLAILVLILSNTYMITKFENLDGCYKKHEKATPAASA